jgi:hypothetical protein
MCFSATASLESAAVLGGVAAVALARNQGKTRMLALMPLLFAAQQLSEGVVWLTIGSEPERSAQTAAVNLFLGFALVLWPPWLPLALWRLEDHPARRKLLGALAGAGLAVAAVGATVLIALRPHAQVAGHSIHYVYGLPGGRWTHLPYLALYVLATVVPFFVATLPLGRTIGVVLVVALAATVAMQKGALTSLWCFFAAIISVLVVMALDRAQRAAWSPTAPLPA